MLDFEFFTNTEINVLFCYIITRVKYNNGKFNGTKGLIPKSIGMAITLNTISFYTMSHATFNLKTINCYHIRSGFGSYSLYYII